MIISLLTALHTHGGRHSSDNSYSQQALLPVQVIMKEREGFFFFLLQYQCFVSIRVT